MTYPSHDQQHTIAVGVEHTTPQSGCPRSAVVAVESGQRNFAAELVDRQSFAAELADQRKPAAGPQNPVAVAVGQRSPVAAAQQSPAPSQQQPHTRAQNAFAAATERTAAVPAPHHHDTKTTNQTPAKTNANA